MSSEKESNLLMPVFVTKNLSTLQGRIRVFANRSRKGVARVFKKRRIKPKALWRATKKKAAYLRRKYNAGFIAGPETLADNIRFFSNPGPGFEQANPIDARHLPSRAKTIAFYLPQFHAFDENDEWWGTGFTEWRNVARGTPRFRGHYQPRVPRDLGFYDLSHLDTIAAQCELAKHNGVDAFCFYYYWFNGKRLMEKPLDLFAESDIDQQFCIMWANENWTRTWDGMENDVLIKQDYLEEDEDDFIADTARYMADDRYVRLNGQPLFILYRPALMDEAAKTIARWRQKWTAALGETPLVMMVQGFGEEDPRVFDLDGAVEFPPHKVCAGLDNISERCHVLDSNYKGLVRDYSTVVEKSLQEEAPPFPLIKTVSPHWDNDARREGLGMTIHGSTPKLYEKWLKGAIDFATQNPVNDESVVFINAWNEWAEGAYLEPDVHYGHAYLNATKRATKSLPVVSNTNKLLLVGHDAHKHGAQMLLLNMAKIYTRSFGMDVVILVKEGGPLVAEYQRIAPTHVLNKMGKSGLRKLLAQHEFEAAICNTSVTGDIVPTLRSAGIQVLSLIHELPNLIRDYKLESNIQSIATHAHHVVFPAAIVNEGFAEFTDSIKANQLIKPQGTYTPIQFDAQAREELRSALGISSTDKLVIGVGYADLRKGFDLFIDAARRFERANTDVHFAWVGALSADMQRWIETDFSRKNAQQNIHVVGFSDRVKDYYSAADCLFLPSCEDPYPTVVLEAMHVGLPVIAYQGTTGCDALLASHGVLVEYGNHTDLDNAIVEAVNEKDDVKKRNRKLHVDENCQFDDYCFSLLETLHPSLQRVSVVVPNYNYAHYLEQRMNTIFAQNVPVYEVLFLDDNSSDKSIDVLQRVARKAKRDVRVITEQHNSGKVFTQWQRAASAARGNFLWIAEADDSADARFLEAITSGIQSTTSLVFCDSKQIDSAGQHLSKSYQHYYAELNRQLFSSSFSMDGQRFAELAMSVRNSILNVSGVVWKTEQLVQAMDSIVNELSEYELVGDWRLYLELLVQEGAVVSFVAESLNVHRRHGTSVTQSLSAQQHLNEIAAIHEHVCTSMQIDQDTKLAMGVYLDKLARQFEADEKDVSKAA